MISDQGRKEQMERLLLSNKQFQFILDVPNAWVLLNACQIAIQDENMQSLKQLPLVEMTTSLGRLLQQAIEKLEPKSAPFMEAGWDRTPYVEEDEEDSAKVNP